MISFRRCASRTTHIKRWKIYIEWIKTWNKKNHFGKFFAIIEPYDCHIRLWWCWNAKKNQNKYIYLYICVQYQFERISFFFHFIFALVFAAAAAILWVCVCKRFFFLCSLVVIEFYRNIYIPCFVALQKYDYEKRNQTNVYDIVECWSMEGKKAIASHVYSINWFVFVCVGCAACVPSNKLRLLYP